MLLLKVSKYVYGITAWTGQMKFIVEKGQEKVTQKSGKSQYLIVFIVVQKKFFFIDLTCSFKVWQEMTKLFCWL